MFVDPLSDVLHLLDARSIVTNGLEVGGRWAFRFPAPHGLKFFAMVRGSAWFLSDATGATRLAEGDVLLLNENAGYVLAADRETSPLDASIIFAEAKDGIGRWGEVADTVMLGGRVDVDRERGSLLLDVLPVLVHISSEDPDAAVARWLIDRLAEETAAGRPGAALAANQLSQLIVLQLIRAHLGRASRAPDWLGGLADEKVARALALMHGDPGRRWTLEELAHAVASSRTAFALRFRQHTGMTALAYLQRWRMHLAEVALARPDASVGAVARSLGYGSESAFSTAFKRVIGRSPSAFLRSQDQRGAQLDWHQPRSAAIIWPDTAGT